MGIYNPHAPYVLGQEWVDIREEGYQFSSATATPELGHTFTPTANRTLTTGRFYVKEEPGSSVLNQAMQMAVYQTGREAITGPIRQVIIPCNAGAATGSVWDNNLATASSSYIVNALFSPGGSALIAIPNADVNSKALEIYFATNQYAQLLMGKRILKVELLHSLTFNPIRTADVSTPLPVLDSVNQNMYLLASGIPFSAAPSVPISLTGFVNDLAMPQPGPQAPNAITSIDLGEVNYLWNGSTSTSLTSEVRPWRYQELQRFEINSGVNRYAIHYEFGASSDATLAGWQGEFFLDYAALRITFCEENRVAYGMSLFGGSSAFLPAFAAGPYNRGQNIVTMRDPVTWLTNPVLTSGTQYTAVVTQPDPGAFFATFANNNYGNGQITYQAQPTPTLNALREMDASPVHIGVQVNKTTSPGETFVKETTHVLPQISLHTSGGPLTEMHVYGLQAVGQVYGTVTATQEILDSAAGGSASWPQVRYYARRFGNTTIPLTLTIATQSVALPVADFDALDEILDGWKEVTLRFTTAPVMGTGTNPQAVWSAATELAGNRWEVLGASALALSGTAGNLLNLSPDALSTATYGQPSAGSTINMGWITQYAPPVSATADDQAADAVLMFSQDMNTVTGFTVTQASQALSGVGLDCVTYPWYVPTRMVYNQLTWSATAASVPVSGFGGYEIQRMDAYTDWQTIADLSSPSATGFRDYEARIGLLTSYRIRAANALDFAGQWSSTVSITSSTPAVTGEGITATSRLLLFTTNEHQDGSQNLAYASAFASDTTEPFAFPEAGFTQYQLMYNRDYQVAFRPQERGGSVFARTVLVQAASISPLTLPDFTSFRNLAWDDIPYVCVRDEDGNRWFANIAVPGGRVQGNRRQLYFADVVITEVTATADVVEI